MIWSGVAHATLSLNPSEVAFGPRSVNGPAHTINRTLETTEVSETYDNVNITGTGCGVVSMSPTSGTVLTTGLAITISYDPIDRTAVSCTVELREGTMVRGSFTVTGTGTAPVIAVPASTSFGSHRVQVAGATSTVGVVVQNTGDDTLSITNLSTTGDYALAATPTFPIDVAGGNSTTINVTFDPTASGTRTGDLVITSNALGSPTTNAPLTGVGTNAVIRADDVVFGAVTNGTTSTLNLVVNNIAAAPVGPLRVTNATMSGGTWFAFAGSCSGSSCTINADVTTTLDVPVTCSPPANASGMQQTMVMFTHDGDSGDAAALLTCTAGRAEIIVDEPSLAFGNVVVGTTTAPRTVIITNIGNRDLVYSISKVGAAEARYALGGACLTNCTLAPSAMASFTVAYSPDAVGPQNITVRITNNDPDSNPLDIPVTGSGVRPEITGPPSIAFGDVELGKPSAPQALTITNTGTSPLTITSAVVQAGAGDYSATGNAGSQVVAVGASATWNLTCDPQAQGPRNGNFRIVSDAQNTPTLDVPLTCTGRRGHLEVSPASIAFGNVQQDTIATVDVTLTNSGNLPVSSITATVNPNNAGYTVVNAPASLAANTSATVTIRFAPTTTATGGAATVTFAGVWGSAPTTATSAQLAVTGTGTTNGYAVSSATLDFGNFRYDTTPTRTFCITNTGESPVAIQSMMFVPTGATASNEYAVTQVQRQTACGTAGTTVTLPQTLATGEILEVTVRAQPANRTGPLTGNLTIASDLPTNPNRVVALTGNSITAMLTVVPGATVNLGDVDIQGGAPAMATVRLRNTGAAPLDLGSFARTANAAFTFTLPADTTLQPNTETTFVVTYAPTTASATPETVTITHSIAGDIASPAMGMIVLSGRGIDRDLQILEPLPVFPSAFRNPGVAGPVRNVSIRNVGTAPLVISSITATNPAFNVLDPEPITIPPSATHDVRVRFEPKGLGTSRGKLQIVNDDDDDGPPITTKTTEVDLEGICMDRMVTLDPNRISVGFIELGQTITLPDALVVRSTDANNTFTIRNLESDDPAFSVDFVAGITLERVAPERQFDVTFTPDRAGEFNAKLRLFIDEDPEHQAEIELVGTAVFVDARGGGGCATTDGAGFGLVFFVLALVVRRRAALALLLLAIPAPTGARLAHGDNVSLSVFDPTPATVTDGFQLQSPVVGKHGAWSLNALYSYAQDPLLHLGTPGGERGVITDSSRLELGAAVALLGAFELGASMPFYSQSGDAPGDPATEFSTTPADGSGTGDLRVHGKVGIVNHTLDGDGRFALSGAIGVTVPTSTEGMLTGSDAPTARVLALGSLVPGAFENRLTITSNLGAVIRSPAEYKNLEQKSGVVWGLGAAVRVADPVWIAGEMFGELSFSGREKMDGSTTVLSPIEWLAGLRWRPDPRFTLSAAAGRGLTSAAGAPALRGVLMLAFTPSPDGAKRTPRERTPDTDADGDGIVDRLDQCDDAIEDIDLFDDTDGCPDLDNDKDGVEDLEDRCDLEAEDKDNFQDDDGCVDKDNDGDGLADAADKCPTDAEDKDGHRDTDGCSDPDNDGDGLADAGDACPNEKEVINGVQDDDGCPDRGGSMLVVMAPDRIELMEGFQFRGAVIEKKSFNLLGQIAATMRAHPEVLRVRIGVHVSAGRDEDKDRELSEKRGQAIKEWLVQWGIAEKRLDVRAYGSTKPLGGPPAADERVELVIMDKK